MIDIKDRLRTIINDFQMQEDEYPVQALAQIERLEAENAALKASNERMEAALYAVQEACLFAEDDGQIGVASEPYISPELFDQICEAISPSQPVETDADKPCGTCGGSGTITAQKNWVGDVVHPCPDCNGTGRQP